MRIRKGLATGVGSLPHTDADRALDLIFKYVPHAPFWPQLPKRDFREGMVLQFSENLPCLKLRDKGVFFDPKDKDRELETFYERFIADDIEHFRISADFAAGLHSFYARLKAADLKDIDFIKVQVTGPFTFLASIKDQEGRLLLHDAVFKQAAIKALAMKLRWQIRLFKQFGKPLIAFIDEPYLGALGSAYTPVNREDVLNGLAEFTGEIKEEDVLLGVHCCGNTDWSVFTDTPAIGIINFDAFNFQDKFVLYADNLKGFLQKGGIICWGIVPTQDFDDKTGARELYARLNTGIESLVKKGIAKELLRERLMLSPACGLGTFTPQESEKIFKLLYETSLVIR